jgi:hypothetical protein
MDIGPLRRIIEVEPFTLPVPEEYPEPATTPVPVEPEPSEPGR